MSGYQLDLPGGQSVAIDEKGYLLDWRDWSPEVAEVMATADGVTLDDEHWAILEIFRGYFERYEIEPPMRALVRQAGEVLGDDKGSSRYLYQLFRDGPGTQACRYAGLPRPVSCV